MSSNIIETSDPGIVVKEIPIKLSDEKFKGALSRAYERAQKDTEKLTLNKFYSVFLSFAGTLFLSLLTSDFGAVGKINAETVTNIAWGLCLGSAVLGFILLGKRVSKKIQNDTNNRDAAVNEIFKQYVTK